MAFRQSAGRRHDRAGLADRLPQNGRCLRALTTVWLARWRWSPRSQQSIAATHR